MQKYVCSNYSLDILNYLGAVCKVKNASCFLPSYVPLSENCQWVIALANGLIPVGQKLLLTMFMVFLNP